MSDEIKKENSPSDTERHYMRLSNLPWSASQQDIQVFFKGIQIPEGGISIHKRDVFIAFLSNQDLSEALKKNGNSLLGAKIYLSRLDSCDFYRLRHKNVCRVLHFSRRTLEGLALRRIRPTLQANDRKDMFSIFNPEENEFKCLTRSSKEDITVKRKIKPTQIDDVLRFDSSNFEDRYSFEALQISKKMKLDEKYFKVLPMRNS